MKNPKDFKKKFYDHKAQIAQSEIEWKKWLEDEGHIFREIPFPPTALIDRFHFDSYIGDGIDFFEYEPFSLDDLTDKEALQVLLAVENRVCEKLMSWIIIDLRKRFGLPCEFENDGVTWSPIPKSLIDKILK
jgi:hypothetical protein